MRPIRVTNGQRAAVCGLAIAGLSMEHACQIIGVSYQSVVGVLPHDWAATGARLWSAAELADMRARWLAGEKSASIAGRHGVQGWTVRRLAISEGWPPRRVRRLAPAARIARHGAVEARV